MEDTEKQTTESKEGKKEEYQIPVMTLNPTFTENDSERLKHIDSTLEQLCGQIGNLDENGDYMDQIMQYFKSVKSRTDTLLTKLNDEVLYTRSLEDKLKKRSLEYENVQLKKALIEEQGRVTLACETVEKKLEEVLAHVQSSFDFFEKSVTDCCSTLDEKAGKITDLKNEIENIIIEYNRAVRKNSEDQYVLFQNDCKKVLESYCNEIGEVKGNVLSFLKTCEKQNQELIKRIPMQKRERSWKDYMIYVIGCVSLIGMILQIIL